MSSAVDKALDAMYAGYEASARKRGRNPRLPYVPVVLRPHAHVQGRKTEQQLQAKAFATHEEAVAYAQRTIGVWRDNSRFKLESPSNRFRAFRAQWDVAEPTGA